MKRSPAATRFPYASAADPETTERSALFATSVSGAATSVIAAGTPGPVSTGAPAVPRKGDWPFASMERMRPSEVVVRVSAKVNRAESTPAGTVISKMGAPPPRLRKVPLGRSVQSVSVSEVTAAVRFPKASKTRTVTLSGTPATSRRVSGQSEIRSGPPGVTSRRCRSEVNPVAVSRAATQ